MIAGQEVGLDLILRRAENLVKHASALALALEDLGVDLPPAYGGEVDQAQLRAIATLYLASELEAAGVISAAEMLTSLARTGSLTLDLGNAAPLIEAFWQGRNQRATSAERLGFFSGLFGVTEGPDHAEHPPNTEFEERLLDLCEALYKLDQQATNNSWGGVAQQARVRQAAQQMVANLIRISNGMTVFMAQDILTTIKAALEILGHRAIKAAFHARSVWEVVAAIEKKAKEALTECDQHVQRGQAGMTLLAWLADAAPILETTDKPIVGLDNPVIAAATQWLQASLALTENSPPPPTAAPNPKDPNPAGSPWAALAR